MGTPAETAGALLSITLGDELSPHRRKRYKAGIGGAPMTLSRVRLSPAIAVLLLAGPPVFADEDGQIFELGTFRFESGVDLPNARLSYVTHGNLNAEKSNAVLVPAWCPGGHHDYVFPIVPAQAVYPPRYVSVATALFANGFSSSPTNAPPPVAGPDFPEIAIRHNVNAVHRLLTEKLGITHLRAVIGFSMGAQQ